MIKSAYLIIILALTIPFSVFADYKIILKNGNEFVVEDYKEVDGKITFYKWGGEIEIEKDTIEEIKEVKPSKTYDETSPTEVIRGDAPVDQQTPEKGKDSSKQDIENRLKEIAKEKAEMMTEAEKLNKEKKQLEDDVKKEGMLTTIGRKREMEKRTSEITEKINKFNEELNKLNQEQEKLLKEIGPQQK